MVHPEGVAATARWMAGLAADWDRRLSEIKRIAESLPGHGGPGPDPGRPAAGTPTPASRATAARRPPQAARRPAGENVE